MTGPSLHHRSVLPILLIAAALSGCENTVAPGLASRAPLDPAAPLLGRGPGGTDMVPLAIREWMRDAEDAVPVLCEGGLEVARNHWTGSAQVTHLGRSVVDTRIDSCTTELVLVGEEVHLWTAFGTTVYTGANGDELWVDLVLMSYEPSRIATALTITGGTGRFAGASGAATGEGSRAADAFVAYTESYGSVSRPNS